MTADDLDAPITRRDLLLFREDIKASFATFEANTRTVVVGLMQDLIDHIKAMDDYRAEIRDAFRDAGARMAELEARVRAMEERCAGCPHKGEGE